MRLPKPPVLKIPTLSKRERILVTLFVLLSLAALYYKFIFVPQLNNITNLQVELEKQQQVLELRLEQGWNNIALLQAKSDQLNSQINKIYAKVPNIKNEPGLLVNLYDIVRANNLWAAAIKFGELEAVKDRGCSSFDVSFEVTGYNENIYNFIDGLENYSRLNRISEIKFEPVSSRINKCSMTVQFYVLHKVQNDPSQYSFMDGVYGKGLPYQIFNVFGNSDLKTESSTSAADSKMPEWLYIPDEYLNTVPAPIEEG